MRKSGKFWLIFAVASGLVAAAPVKDPRIATLQKEVRAAEAMLKRAQAKNAREQKTLAAYEKREGGKKSETMLSGCDARVCLNVRRCKDEDMIEAFGPEGPAKRATLLPGPGSKQKNSIEAMTACWAVFEAHQQKFKGLSTPCQTALMTCERIRWTADWIRKHEIATDAEKALGIAERQLIEAREQLAELQK